MRAICVLTGTPYRVLLCGHAADAQDFVTDGLVAVYTLNEGGYRW